VEVTLVKSTTAMITAFALLALVKRFGPTIEGEELVFDTDLPEDLEDAMSILHTGVRALLTCKPWWGSAACDAKRPKVEVLDSDKPIPSWCGLVCVEGDAGWERIHPNAIKNHPELFAPVAAMAAGQLTRRHR
jgi:hypothetical protein